MSLRGISRTCMCVLIMLVFTSLRTGFCQHRQPTVLVLPFDNSSRDVSLKRYQENIPALLELFFSHSNSYRVIDRVALEEVLQEQQMNLVWPLADENKQRIGRLAQAEIIISGGFVKYNHRLIINTHAYDVETGRLLSSAKVKGVEKNIVELSKKTYKLLVNDLKYDLPKLDQENIDENPLSNLHFVRGLSFYYSAQYNQAIGEFIRAQEEPSLHNLTHLWMANSYLAQRDFGLAYIELKRLSLNEFSQLRAEDIEQKLNACMENLTVEEVKLFNRMVSF